MAHSPEQILSLLPLLDEHIADELESETIDFKECPTEAKLQELSKEMAVCLGNVSNGTVAYSGRVDFCSFGFRKLRPVVVYSVQVKQRRQKTIWNKKLQ